MRGKISFMRTRSNTWALVIARSGGSFLTKWLAKQRTISVSSLKVRLWKGKNWLTHITYLPMPTFHSFTQSYSLPSFLADVDVIPTIQSYEVCNKLLHLKIDKSEGPDNIPPRILREFAYELAEPATLIFNTSISLGAVPLLWKASNIIPVPKVRQPSCESDTTPISLTAVLVKVLEDYVVQWMLEDIGQNIDTNQFGSVKGSSTTYCLLDMVSNWLAALDNPRKNMFP